MIVDGVTVVDAPGPTSPDVTTGTYTGPTGNQNFTFYYGEADTAPAVFTTTLIPSIPEPATMLLLGFGMIAMGMFIRRKFKK